MDNKEKTNHVIATAGWGLLLIWWGVCFAIGPITIGMSAIGTGLILLGANTIRLILGIPRVTSTTVVGVVALVWGSLDRGFRLSFDALLAALLIVIGGIMIVSLVPRLWTA
jgi:hypothetical protein